LFGKGLIEKVGGDVVSEFPGFRRAKVREHDDADPLSWIALDAAGKAQHAATVVPQQLSKLFFGDDRSVPIMLPLMRGRRQKPKASSHQQHESAEKGKLKSSLHHVGWMIRRNSSRLPVVGEAFLLTSSFIERVNRRRTSPAHARFCD
jgi:hypothetical protein